MRSLSLVLIACAALGLGGCGKIVSLGVKAGAKGGAKAGVKTGTKIAVPTGGQGAKRLAPQTGRRGRNGSVGTELGSQGVQIGVQSFGGDSNRKGRSSRYPGVGVPTTTPGFGAPRTGQFGGAGVPSAPNPASPFPRR